jgi:hypothetical protein
MLKQPEEYYYSQLILFLPWNNEDELLQQPSYEQYYHDNENVILQNKAEVEHHSDIIEQATQQFAELGPPQHAFDLIAPSTTQENDDSEDPILDGDYAFLDPENDFNTNENEYVPSTNNKTVSSLNIKPGIWPQEQYHEHLRSLNFEQRDAFDKIQKWCIDSTITNEMPQTPEQLLLFITGGAGTGKSHLIAAIYQMALRTLQKEGENPDEIHILLSAPTGTAAHNISGTTLHSAFLLPLGQVKSYNKLSDDKRNTLRAKAGKLQLLIIDEISMVGSNLFLHLHYRLSEIKSSNKLFGGVSVVVFGDLYQLPPVKQHFIFIPSSDILANIFRNLWSHFQLIELSTVMRQKEDLNFAQLLNRIRTQNQSEEDIKILKLRNFNPEQCPHNALGVYARNCDVDAYNGKQLSKLHHVMESFVAVDRKPSSLKNYVIKDDPKFTGGLSTTVKLAIGARIMLIRNIDVSDGLVNGAQGEITGFIKSTNNKTIAIAVKFYDEKIGKETIKKCQFKSELNKYPLSTPIQRTESSFTVTQKNKSLTITRYQFPLKLSWACTIHKVQGLTCTNIVVSFDGRFGDGQAYVALSRATSIKGLYLLKFDEKKIRCSKKVTEHMMQLRQNNLSKLHYSTLNQWKDLIVSTINIRSLCCHRLDLLCDPVFQNSALIVLSETWLTSHNCMLPEFETKYFIFHSNKPTQTGRGGGVTILARQHNFNAITVLKTTTNISNQIVTATLTSDSANSLYLIALYNSPNSNITDIKIGLQSHIASVKEKENNPCILIAGDFNENLLKNRPSSIYEYLTTNHFVNSTSGATHISGSSIDNIYYSDNFSLNDTSTFYSYYTDHCWVTSSFGFKSFQ